MKIFLKLYLNIKIFIYINNIKKYDFEKALFLSISVINSNLIIIIIYKFKQKSETIIFTCIQNNNKI